MRSWSLEFTDAVVEAKYVAAKFASTYLPFQIFLSVIVLADGS